MKKVFSICKNLLAIYGIVGIVFSIVWYWIYQTALYDTIQELDKDKNDDDVMVEKRGRKTYYCKKQSNNNEE